MNFKDFEEKTNGNMIYVEEEYYIDIYDWLDCMTGQMDIGDLKILCKDIYEDNIVFFTTKKIRIELGKNYLRDFIYDCISDEVEEYSEYCTDTKLFIDKFTDEFNKEYAPIRYFATNERIYPSQEEKDEWIREIENAIKEIENE